MVAKVGRYVVVYTGDQWGNEGYMYYDRKHIPEGMHIYFRGSAEACYSWIQKANKHLD